MSFFSYRPRSRGTSTAMRTSTGPAIAAACGPAIESQLPSFPCRIRRMYGVYPAAVRRPFPVGLSYACAAGACAAAHPLSARAARPRYSRSSLPGASVPAAFAPAITTPSGPPSPSATMLFFGALFSSSQWDSCPSFSPQSGPCPASRRPAATPRLRPRRVRHTRRPRPPGFARRSLLPPRRSKQSSDSALGSVPLGQLVTLAAAAHPEDDRIQHFPPIWPTFRPVGFLGKNHKRISSIRRHNSSENLQDRLPSGLLRGFRRTMAQSPVVVPGSGHCLLRSSFLQKMFRRFSDSY